MSKPDTKKSRDDVVELVEKLLARKLQIKAQLNEIENTIKTFALQMENTQRGICTKDQLHSSNEIYRDRVEALQKYESELRGELFEVSALSRSIPVRRLRSEVNAERIKELVMDAKLIGLSPQLQENLRAGDCVTSCEVCVTSCNSDCITSCTDCVTYCATDCTQCPSSCTFCSSGCTNDATGPYKGTPSYTLPDSLDYPDDKKYLPDNEITEAVAKKYGTPDRIEIDWS